MIEDFQGDESGDVIDADLCIVGGGAAGISIAREFIDSTLSICLLESGGLEYDAPTQAMYVGDNVGLPYFPLDLCRLRYFGGSTNHWNGQCAALSRSDFEHRPWVPHSGWPVSKAELESYYDRAQPLCDLGDRIDNEELFDLLNIESPELDHDLLRMFFYRFSPPVRFGDAYEKELRHANNIRILLNATVVRINTSENTKRVEHVDVRSLSGKTGLVRAKVFVIACGGIENARVLLLPTNANSKGAGNDRDLVGRFFMEHPVVDIGDVVSSDPISLLKKYRRHWFDGRQYWPAFQTGDEAQRQERVLGGNAVLDYIAREDSGTEAAIDVGRSLKNRDMPEALHRKIWRMLKDIDEVVPNAYRYIVRGEEPISEPERLFFSSWFEQAPNPDSRVTLGSEVDALGLPRAQLAWRLTDVDKQTIEVMARSIGIEFGRLGLGRLKLDDWLSNASDSWDSIADEDFRGSFHHMGTTRMSDNPTAGVVDANCCVHGIDNLYVAGSSVFPTSGNVNPTFTLVALALRLADHLRESLG